MVPSALVRHARDRALRVHADHSKHRTRRRHQGAMSPSATGPNENGGPIDPPSCPQHVRGDQPLQGVAAAAFWPLTRALPSEAFWPAVRALPSEAFWPAVRALPSEAFWPAVRALPSEAFWPAVRALPSEAFWPAVRALPSEAF